LAEDGYEVVDIPFDSKLIVSKKDTGLGLMLRTRGTYELVQTKEFAKSVKAGDTVFDIGANVGYYTVLASKLVGKKGRVYAFEPDPRNLELLKRNLMINQCTNVDVIPFVVGESVGSTYLRQDLSNPGESSVSENGRNSIFVNSISIDTFVNQKKIKRIDVIKVDVEGAEVDVIKGGRETLGTQNVKVFIEANQKALSIFGYGIKDLISGLTIIGFKPAEIISESLKRKYKFNQKRLEGLLRGQVYLTLVFDK